MAQLNKTDYKAKFSANSGGAALFKDNTSGDIGADDMRTLGEDSSDTFMSLNDNFIDEDSFASDSATKAPSQQSTKAYISAQIASNLEGLAWKQPVKVATTTAITLSGAQTIDGISCVAGDRVLVKNQISTPTNGIYVVATGAWTRATDADTGTDFRNAVVSVDQGTINADTSWRQTTENITVGSTAITWTTFGTTSPTPGLDEILATFNSADGYTIENLSDPVNQYDAANKNYVDTQVSNNIQSATVTIPSSSVLNIYNVPYQIVAAPGSGKLIYPLSIIISMTYNSSAYVSDPGLAFEYFSGGGRILSETISGFLTGTSSKYKFVNLSTSVVNQAISSYAGNGGIFLAGQSGGNPTSGNSALKVYITYKVITL